MDSWPKVLELYFRIEGIFMMGEGSGLTVDGKRKKLGGGSVYASDTVYLMASQLQQYHFNVSIR